MGRLFYFLNWIIVLGSQSVQTDYIDSVPFLMEDYKVPGVAIGIIQQGEISSLHCYGFANKATQEKVGKHSIFQVGSISKPITAWAFLELIQKGLVGLDESIEKYEIDKELPFLPSSCKEVTFRRILNHTAGFSIPSYKGYPQDKKLPSLMESLYGIKGYHSRLKLLDQPGISFRYSGGGYTVLQLLIETITKKKFHELMAEMLFVPLELNDSSFVAIESKNPSLCTPYDIFLKPLPWLYFTEAAAAGLYTSIYDLTYLIAHLVKERRIILDKMCSVENNGYALGLEVELLNDHNRLGYHFGANQGWRSGLFILPELDSAMIILTNGDNGTALIEDIAGKWIEKITGKTPEFYRQSLFQKNAIWGIFVLSCLGLLIYTYKVLKQIVQNKRRKSFNKKSFFQIIIFSFIAAFWYLIFYTTLSHPQQWVFAAFLPANFKWLSVNVLIFCVEGVALSWFPITSKEN